MPERARFSPGDSVNQAGEKLACVASVSVRFRSKERGTRVKDRAKNGVSWLLFHFSRGNPRIPFLGLSLLRNQTETLPSQAREKRKKLTRKSQ